MLLQIWRYNLFLGFWSLFRYSFYSLQLRSWDFLNDVNSTFLKFRWESTFIFMPPAPLLLLLHWLDQCSATKRWNILVISFDFCNPASSNSKLLYISDAFIMKGWCIFFLCCWPRPGMKGKRKYCYTDGKSSRILDMETFNFSNTNTVTNTITNTVTNTVTNIVTNTVTNTVTQMARAPESWTWKLLFQLLQQKSCCPDSHSQKSCLLYTSESARR